MKLRKKTQPGTKGARQLSLLRLLIVGVVGFAAVTGGAYLVMASVGSGSDLSNKVLFAPYVDTTLTPTLHFEDATDQPAQNVVLGFLVADPSDPCAANWGTYYSLDAAARALDLDRRLITLRERGGDVIVSFGGAINDEMSVACKDVSALTKGYQAAIDRYKPQMLDFDIEGAALSDTEANARRAEAIKRLQTKNAGLEVWLTLPVAPDGLPSAAVTLIDQTLSAGVDLAGVNVMTMDYGGSRPQSMSMRQATERALFSTWQQVSDAFQRAGHSKTDGEIWDMLGATPMIGQNDIPGEVFSLADAEWLSGFASEKGLGRISFWSANRDAQCGSGSSGGAVEQRVSNTCSGVAQEPLQFTQTFMKAAKSRAVIPTETTDEQIAAASRADSLSYDDPRTSPYPIWRQGKAYELGSKVVWQDRVYEAKWYAQGAQPDAPVKNAWDTPWRYLGPVLESDREVLRAVPVAKDGARSRWDSERVYLAGVEVEHKGAAYKAKWWTQGTEPQEDPDQPFSQPWEFLGQIEKAAAGTSAAVTPSPAVIGSPTPAQ